MYTCKLEEGNIHCRCYKAVKMSSEIAPMEISRLLRTEEDVLNLLRSQEVEIHESLRHIVADELAAGIGKSWLRLPEAGSMTDEHMMYGGISEMVLKAGVFVVPPHVSTDIKKLGAIVRGRKKIKNANELLSSLVNRLVRNYGSTPDLTIIVPVEVNRHRGVSIAQKSGGEYCEMG